MPAFVPRGLEAYSKNELFAKRQKQLRAAIQAAVSPELVRGAAEKLREAALAVIKANRSIAATERVSLIDDPAENERSANLARELGNLDSEASEWAALSVDCIIARCGAHVPNRRLQPTGSAGG